MSHDDLRRELRTTSAEVDAFYALDWSRLADEEAAAITAAADKLTRALDAAEDGIKLRTWDGGR